MPEPAPSPRVIRFGVFEADLPAGELRRDGLKVKLQERPFQVLAILLERAGEVVTREELRQRIWPADTFVDFDHSLNSSINKLRYALGDDADNPRFIATVGRRGYRFIAPALGAGGAAGSAESQPALHVVGEDEAASLKAEAIQRPQAGARLARISALAAASIAVLLAAILIFRWLSPLPAPRVVRMVQLSTSARADDWGRLVTDGPRVYFLEREGEHWNLVQTSTTGGEVQRAAAPFQNTKILDLSPDQSEFLAGNFIGRWQEMPLWVMPVQGGPPRRIGDITAMDAAWTPDGKQIVCGKTDGIYVIERDGTNFRKLVGTEANPTWFAWSPDGRVLRFRQWDSKLRNFVLWEVLADGTNLRRFLPGWNNPPNECCGGWTRDGRYFIFTGVRDETASIWAVREKGSLLHRAPREPVRLTSGPIDLFDPVLSKDGKRVFVFGGKPREELMRYDPRSNRLEPYLSWARTVDTVSFKDQDWVTYTVGPQMVLWRSKVDGTERIQLTPPGFGANRPSWSPDGKQIAFQAARPGGSTKVYLISASGGAPEELLPGEGNQHAPDWSPDGKWVVFDVPAETLTRAAQGSGIYQVELKTHRVIKLPGSEGMVDPRWSPDGRYLAALSEDQRKLILYDLRTQKWTEWARGTYFVSPAWSDSSTHIYYQDLMEAQEPIYCIRISDHKRERVAGCDVALRQGVQRCYFAGRTPDGSPLVRLRRSFYDVYALDVDLP